MFISEPTGNMCGILKDFCPKKRLPSRASELAVGNLGWRYKLPPIKSIGGGPGELGN